MNVTRSVIHDLLPAYLAGEASPDTTALVEEFLRQDAGLRRTVEALRARPLPEPSIALPATHEKETLDKTKRMLRWRGILMGLGIFLTLLPMSFVHSDRIRWVFLRDMPPAVTALVWLGALACWASFLYTRRRLQGIGL
jgi:hypothetical protein